MSAINCFTTERRWTATPSFVEKNISFSKYNVSRGYLHDLNMRADLDDRVLQAVKLNKRTGQSTVPLTDMRTLDEKMADLQKLKAAV